MGGVLSFLGQKLRSWFRFKAKREGATEPYDVYGDEYPNALTPKMD
jgi:hypothetical protein